MAQAAKDKKPASKPAVKDSPAAAEPVTTEPVVTEPAAESAAPETTQNAAPAEDPPVPLDAKSAFQAALERKKQAGQARSAHLDGHGGVGGATSSHKATRTFRRKSGSA